MGRREYGLLPATRYDISFDYVFGYRFHKFEHYTVWVLWLHRITVFFAFDRPPNALCKDRFIASRESTCMEANHFLFTEHHYRMDDIFHENWLKPVTYSSPLEIWNCDRATLQHGDGREHRMKYTRQYCECVVWLWANKAHVERTAMPAMATSTTEIKWCNDV